MEDGDHAYFTSYEELSVHELMLKDEPRTRAYQIFIENNSELFRDKVVIDVGAGTGILSLFAAKAGAKKVYAIEGSNLAKLCKNIVAVNGYEENIEVIQSRVEDAILPISKGGADVIISEWMGFYLLHEAMLGSVIFARDKWLKYDGLMVPSTATIYMCPVSMSKYVQQNVNYWDNTYGFNFQPLKEKIVEKNLVRPVIECIDKSQCIANAELVTHLHLNYVAKEDLVKISRSLSFSMTKYGICHGFAFWFDCNFESCTDSQVILSTGPEAPATHWKQTIVLVPEALMVSKDETVNCKLELVQDSENNRLYNISIEVDDTCSDNEEEIDDLVENIEDERIKGMILDALK